MNKMLIGVLVVILIVGGGILLMSSGNDTNETSNSTNTTQSPTPASQNESNTQQTTQEQVDQTTNIDTPQTYTLADIAQHATQEDCWTSINGTVYDLSGYISRHPGGEEIVRACGTDGTSLFETRKTDGGQTVGSGTPHSNKAENMLADLKIGILKQQ